MKNTKATELIAEIGQAHDGSVGQAHAYIDALADVGVKTIKFQTHIAHAESSVLEKFRVNFSYEDKTRYAYWKRMEFHKTEWMELATHCSERGVEFMSTPFSVEAVELLEDVNVERYKIGSGDTSNYLLIDTILDTGKPLVVSTGMSSLNELDELMNRILKRGRKDQISLLQCHTAYPTAVGESGIYLIDLLRKRYGTEVGLSDHSGDIYSGLASAALGAHIIEVHAVFDKRSFGPDSPASLEINQIEQLLRGIKAINEEKKAPQIKAEYQDIAVKKGFARSLALRNELAFGSIITRKDLESKKPGGVGVDSQFYENVIGKRLIKELKAGEFITGDCYE